MLAPMEGVADFVLRDVLTRIGGYDAAVSEFVRVSGSVLPERTYERICPEIGNGSRTAAGTPVAVQLLGSDPALLGENAARLAALSPHGIDLNFGCPARVVNRHGGGAMLLDEPVLLNRIAAAVRRATPAHIPVTAKMRLGVSDPSRALECARALADGGVQALVVHARTKAQGYRAPAHWEWVARIRDGLAVPVVANGEVWSVGDWERCREVGGGRDVMLGRGAVSDPWLALRIRGARNPVPSCEDWLALRPFIAQYWAGVQKRAAPVHACGRLKMWLNMLRRHWGEAEGLYRAVCALGDAGEVSAVLRGHGIAC
ncbi:tRNA-dihydrouridine synthase family protein [Pseudothauera rhizosphaerae]|uniref:tRNA-dihydrouridine(16) synthase n=2 Tax=Pseudothauera rhizosphaerae TaxID=2565932 RepID=A0A4V3WAX7_9RHOO|nr:tRNA-dihydrouridine synthase family protein [Pseudothauera rhizosphaerae]